MKDLKEKLKRRISEMLDKEDLTAEQLAHLTSAVCMLNQEERMKASGAMSALAGLAVANGLKMKREVEDDEQTL